MKFHETFSSILNPAHRAKSGLALAIMILAVTFVAGPAAAQVPSSVETAPKKAKTPEMVAAADESPRAGATVTAGDTEGETDEPFPLSATLRMDTTMGLGSLVGGEQTQPSVSVLFWPTLRLRLPVENLSLSASMTATIYAVNDFGTAYPNGEVIPGDLYFTLSHSRVFNDPSIADGFNISVAFRVYLPTSYASQLFNRVMTIRPSATARLKVGPVTFSYSLLLAKYFATSTTSSIDCANFKDGQCIEGRPSGGSFASQVDGGQVGLTGSGNSSFYVANALSVDFAIVEGLALNLNAAVYNLFGYSSYDADELSSENATPGRSQTDRLIFGAGLSYQFIKNFSAGLSWDVDTVRPFGADGNGLDAIEPVSSLTLTLVGSI